MSVNFYSNIETFDDEMLLLFNQTDSLSSKSTSLPFWALFIYCLPMVFSSIVFILNSIHKLNVQRYMSMVLNPCCSWRLKNDHFISCAPHKYRLFLFSAHLHSNNSHTVLSHLRATFFSHTLAKNNTHFFLLKSFGGCKTFGQRALKKIWIAIQSEKNKSEFWIENS